MNSRKLILICSVTFASLASVAQAENDKSADAAGLAFFEKRIRPVLVEHCYTCHSVDKKKKQGGLLLDTRAGIRRGGDTGSAVVPSSPDQSLILAALRYEDLEMPPKGKLSRKIIKDFERWIRIGAPDPRDGGEEVSKSGGVSLEEGRKFWSFQPIQDPNVPKNRNDKWAASEIDSFILQKQEAAGLAPTSDANPEVILRRLYFDLIGLPPTPTQVREFLKAAAVDPKKAIEEVVDALLDSPRFGERWGRHWLDVARFSESSGGGRTRVFEHAWRYRDYVIRSFNEDKSYARFVAEQIAGDLLPYESTAEGRDNLAATSFLAIGPINYELQDKQLLDMEVIDEQLDTIGKSMLGMTIGCARCHDHKFDPIPTADYYALAGIFLSTKSLDHANVSNPVMRALPLDSKQQQQVAKLNRLAQPLESEIAKIKAQQKKLGGAQTKRNHVALDRLLGVVVDDEQAKYIGTWTASVSVAGYVHKGYHHQSDATAEARYVAKLKPGKYEVRLSYTASTNRASNLPIRIIHCDGLFETRVNSKKQPTIDGTFVSLGEFHFEQQGTVIIGGKASDGVMIADAIQWLPVDGLAADKRPSIKPIVKADPQAETNAKTRSELALRLKAVQTQLAKLKKKHNVDAAPVVMSVQESNEIQDCQICIRGNVHNRGKRIPRGFLSVMLPNENKNAAPTRISKKVSGRLEFAQWIASDKNSLTSRVFVNRVWYWLMGKGIVRSLDNFGAMGAKPSHPELLDHLATRFMADNWGVKQLIRRIVLSRTYQQSSSVSAHSKATDPGNRWYSFMPRRRLDAESIRDAILASSGQLNLSIGGSTIRPGSKSEFNYQFNDSQLDGQRRSVYVPVFRNSLLDLFEVFDFADPNLVMGQRSVSTLPTQALYLMNSPWVMQQSEYGAKRLLNDAMLETESQRIDEVYLLLFGRTPKPGERQIAADYLKGSTDTARWSRFVHTLIASVDFRYLE
jgi:cytochrome c553